MYSIEQLDGEKVLSRSRGFTVDTCVSAVDEAMESPEFQGLSTGDKVRGRGAAREAYRRGRREGGRGGACRGCDTKGRA
jgi:hypothetical protein